MTVLEKKGSGFRGQGSGKESARPCSSLNPNGRTLNPRRRFAAYFTRSGWAHVLLLLAAWMFLFPFVWMLATSVKTDEELMEPGVVASPRWRPDDGYPDDQPELPVFCGVARKP